MFEIDSKIQEEFYKCINDYQFCKHYAKKYKTNSELEEMKCLFRFENCQKQIKDTYLSRKNNL